MIALWCDMVQQYQEAFADAAIDGAFLFDLSDEDLGTIARQLHCHQKFMAGRDVKEEP